MSKPEKITDEEIAEFKRVDPDGSPAEFVNRRLALGAKGGTFADSAFERIGHLELGERY